MIYFKVVFQKNAIKNYRRTEMFCTYARFNILSKCKYLIKLNTIMKYFLLLQFRQLNNLIGVMIKEYQPQFLWFNCLTIRWLIELSSQNSRIFIIAYKMIISPSQSPFQLEFYLRLYSANYVCNLKHPVKFSWNCDLWLFVVV